MQHRSVVPILVAIFFTLLLSSDVRAQHSGGLSTMGTDFFVPFVHTPDTCVELERYRKTSLFATALEPAHLEVYYFDSQGREYLDTAVDIAPLRYAQIGLKLKLLPKTQRGDSAEYTAVHVRSSSPVALQYFATGPYNGTMSALLPTELLDTRYVAASTAMFKDFGNDWGSCIQTATASSTFTIVAVEDNTHATIGPNDPTLFGKLGYRYGQIPYTVTLNRGQVYTVKSDTTDETFDETGSRISSDRPIAVWSGHEGAYSEYRNILAQQLLPVSRWDSIGYFGMPMFHLVESCKALTNDYGNSIRIETSATSHVDSMLDLYGSLNVDASGFTNIYSRSRKLIEAVEFSGETMMRLAPWSQAATTHLFSKPRSTNDCTIRLVFRADRVHTIRYWQDGRGPFRIDSLSGATNPSPIPNRPELGTVSLRPAGGTYLFHDDSAFLAYVYGTELAGGYLPPIDFGCPGVQAFRAISGSHPYVEVTSWTCPSWNIRATAGGAPLVRASLLYDTLGFFVKRTADSGFVSTNVQFETGVPITVGDSSRSFSIRVTDPVKPAVAYLWVIDKFGNDTVIQLRYAGGPLHTSVPALSFPRQPLSRDSCLNFTLRNDASSSETVTISPISLADPAFTLTSSSVLPATLDPGDSITFECCYHGGLDTTIHRDTAIFRSTCSSLRLPLFAQSKKVTLSAYDLSFGDIQVGTSRRLPLRLRNVSSDTIWIAGIERIIGDTSFTLIDTALLPLAIGNDSWRFLTFEYRPTSAHHDSAVVYWRSDANSGKLYSTIVGSGVVMGVEKPESQRKATVRLDPNGVLQVEGCEHAGLSIFDILGRVVLRPVQVSGGIMLNVSSLPTGTYVVRLNSNTSVYSKTIHIEK